MISVPAIIYLTVGCMHVVQQMLRNRALRTVAAPQTDYIVQALVMACIVELLNQNGMNAVAWTLTAPAIVVSIIIVFYFVMFQCTV